MVATPHPSALPFSREPLGRATLLHGSAIVAIALLTLLSFGVLARAAAGRSATAASASAVQHGLLSSTRVAGLATQYALGDAGVRGSLRTAIDNLAATQRELDRAGVAPGTQAELSRFVRTARRIAALPPHAAGLSAAAMPLAAALNGPLPVAFDDALIGERMRAGKTGGMLVLLGAIMTLTLLALFVLETLVVVRPLARRAARLAAELTELARLATTDALTGTLNNRGFQDRGAVEIHKARRYSRPLSLLLINPDHLEPISAAHGEAAGDSVLQALSSTLFDGTRITDLVGRVGGSEFAVLLPETDLAGAQLLAERLRTRIGDLSVPVADTSVSCTVSIGVSAAEKDATFFWPTFARADEALYEAKMRGRNRVFVNSV